MMFSKMCMNSKIKIKILTKYPGMKFILVEMRIVD